jgi:hypothetical protein
MAEWAKRQADGKTVELVNTLVELQPGINDFPWLEANQQINHLFTKVTTLPSGTWRKINDGASKSSGQTKQETERISILESWSQVDAALVDMAPDPAQFRWQEDQLFLEGLGQTFFDALFKDINSDPEKFSGFASRYNALNATVNVAGTGGTGSDLTSIWIVQLGPNAVHMVFPKGNKQVGIDVQDKGIVQVAGVTSNTLLDVYLTKFVMNCGIVIKNDKCVQRICNIEVSGSSNIFDPHDIIDAINRLPNAKPENAIIYCNRTMKGAMEKSLYDKANMAFIKSDIENGMPVTRFNGIKVQVTDSITNTETALA